MDADVDALDPAKQRILEEEQLIRDHVVSYRWRSENGQVVTLNEDGSGSADYHSRVGGWSVDGRTIILSVGRSPESSSRWRLIEGGAKLESLEGGRILTAIERE